MSGREFLKRSESLVGAVHDCKRLLASVRPPERQGLPAFAKRYLATAALKKLEIGSGPKPHEVGSVPVELAWGLAGLALARRRPRRQVFQFLRAPHGVSVLWGRNHFLHYFDQADTGKLVEGHACPTEQHSGFGR